MFTFFYLFGFWPAVAVLLIVWRLGKDADRRDLREEEKMERLERLYRESALYGNSDH